LYWQLERHQIQASLEHELKHIALNAWQINEGIFARFRALMKRLEEKELQFIPLKGYPLAVDYYPDPSTRPMGDIDLWVRPEAFDRTVLALEKLGYKKRNPLYQVTPLHAMEYITASRVETIDLHWQVVHGGGMQQVDQVIWEAAEQSTRTGDAKMALSSTDLLFVVLIHAGFIGQISPIRWVADTSFILAKQQHPIDWPRLLYLAEISRRGPILAEQLQFLHDRYASEIPLRAIETLRTQPLSRFERVNFAVVALTPRPGWLYKMKAHYRNIFFGIEDFETRNIFNILAYVVRYWWEKTWLRITNQYSE
jgi:hypothetical protein